jgi:hypothetical protein
VTRSVQDDDFCRYRRESHLPLLLEYGDSYLQQQWEICISNKIVIPTEAYPKGERRDLLLLALRQTLVSSCDVDGGLPELHSVTLQIVKPGEAAVVMVLLLRVNICAGRSQLFQDCIQVVHP